jgi:uncharacterized RDD family membrane protein YckC
MQDAPWYYVQRDGQRLGPVAAADILAAYQNGTIARDTLVWRQGMPAWVPLLQVAAEIGIGDEAPSAAPPPVPEASPPIITTRRSQGIDREDVVYAGFVRRWVALTLDSVILAIPSFVLFFVIGIVSAAASRSASSEPSPAFMLFGYALWFVVAMLYYALQESSAYQATLGKRALGIKVTDGSGRRLTLSHAIGRWFAASLSYLTCYIGFLMAGFTERKRALHDMVADTLVVDRWAYTEYPERQQRELPGCLIAVVIGLFVVPFFVGIIAAITIAQYQDYVIRAQVSEGASLADGMKTAVAEYYANNHRFPATNSEAGLAAPESIAGNYVGSVDASGGTVVATYSSAYPHKANRAIDGKTLRFIPKIFVDRIEWQCSSTNLKQKWCSSACDCGG